VICRKETKNQHERKRPCGRRFDRATSGKKRYTKSPTVTTEKYPKNQRPGTTFDVCQVLAIPGKRPGGREKSPGERERDIEKKGRKNSFACNTTISCKG